METVLTKKAPSILDNKTSNINYIYFGKDLIFRNKLNSFLGNQNNLNSFNNSQELIAFVHKNKELKNIVLSEFSLENGESGLKLYRTLLSDNPDTYFFLLSDKNTTKNQMLLAKKKGVRDVLLKNKSIQNLMLRIRFHSEKRKKRITHKNLLIKTEISLIKRIFDITLTAFALTLLSPVLILVGILIKIDSPGPIFYISKRVGTNGRVFNFYKFRSMKKDASSNIDKLKGMNQYVTKKTSDSLLVCKKCENQSHPCSPILIVDGDEICESLYLRQKKNNKSSFIKFKNDPRITRLGRLLRKTSIDELPQLLNILKGDMSIVGNRPLPIYEAEQLTDDQWSVRFLAPAGLTGLWQISKRGKSKMSEYERKELDKKYAVNHSFLGDLKIILLTIPALFQSENV
jgi:lipopolysaccharide/colanic/teichoic acid biosynthesis glycosyltransferase